MASSIGVKNYLVQARKAAMNGNYDFLQRVISDVGTLMQRYPKLYPTEEQGQSFQGKTSMLLLQGNIDLRNPNTGREDIARIKIKFPKDYPKSRPIVALQNLNQQLYDPNPAYVGNGLVRYDRSPKDGRMYLFLEFFELKNWSITSDLVKIIGDTERKLAQNSPFLKKNTTNKESKMGAMLSINNDSNPALRAEMMKTKHQFAELENDFETLMANKEETTLALVYNEIVERQLCVKFNEMDYMRKRIDELVQECLSKAGQEQGNIEPFLQMTPQSKKLVTYLSQREALEECLQFLKDKLKNGAKMSELNDSFKKLFEEFFLNQLAFNQP